METNEISAHLCRVYVSVKSANCWMTAKDIAQAAKVADRTARSHALRLVNLGVFDQAEVFPAHRYKISEKASKRNKAIILRLEAAHEIFHSED